ncbi:MAG: tRNA (N6-isopentenyl adenosine(37)-C2)-methylthiotransferase MiaB [Nitrospirales bacterium]|nr:tRNA (N6-isopentenyl adenosine(37)-C2)-methylthiotransferase MiaB [Nitrospirales bacterium]
MAYHVYMETFGCQMNEYDTELVRSLLKTNGFQMTQDSEEAHVVLLNTCAIRENAHNRVYGHLGKFKVAKQERGLVIGVLGCMAQNLKKELQETRPFIDVLVGPDGYRQLPVLLTRALEQHEKGQAVELSEYETYEQIVPDRVPGVHGWIAVMRGCDNFCTFCVVPYTRGRERSREPQGIVREAQDLADRGYKQITLLGQNVNSYQADGWGFARLIKVVADVPGIERVRFMSPHPKDFPPALLEAIADHPHICRQIHLPLQSGNDRMLEMMGRTYTRREYLELVDVIRQHGTIALSTDVICGFCSETQEEYLETYRLLEEVAFQSTFVFKYSERKQTIASRKYPDDVSDVVKSERVMQLIELQKKISIRKNQQKIGRTVQVLVEGHARKFPDQWMGHAEDNTTVVWEKNGHMTQPGDLVSVLVHDVSAGTLFGHMAPVL